MLKALPEPDHGGSARLLTDEDATTWLRLSALRTEQASPRRHVAPCLLGMGGTRCGGTRRAESGDQLRP